MRGEMTTAEKELLRNAISVVYDAVKQRLRAVNASEEETSSSLYAIQDFCSGVEHTDDNGLRIP